MIKMFDVEKRVFFQSSFHREYLRGCYLVKTLFEDATFQSSFHRAEINTYNRYISLLSSTFNPLFIEQLLIEKDPIKISEIHFQSSFHRDEIAQAFEAFLGIKPFQSSFHRGYSSNIV